MIERALFKPFGLFFRHEFQSGFRLFELFLRDSVDEEDTVQMVDFMLKAFREEIRAFDLDDLSIQQCCFEDDACGAGDISADAWQAEAAFARTDRFWRERDEFRIDEE